jgi:hypothetical protein
LLEQLSGASLILDLEYESGTPAAQEIARQHDSVIGVNIFARQIGLATFVSLVLLALALTGTACGSRSADYGPTDLKALVAQPSDAL